MEMKLNEAKLAPETTTCIVMIFIEKTFFEQLKNAIG